MPLRIYLTGRITIEFTGKLLDQDAFPGRQGLLAFTRLLLDRHVSVSRDHLAAVLWPDGLPSAWDTALNAIVSKLRLLLERAGLERSEVISSALGCYQLHLPTDTWVDLEAASDAIHEAEGFLKDHRYREAWAAAQVAYHISRRPFLASEAGPWVDEQRERLRTIFARASETLAKTYIWNGEPSIAVDVAKELIAIQPFRETGYQLLMRAHAAAGNRAEALLIYEHCRKRISDELGVSPSPDTQAVYLEVLHSR
jgi:SARP family transcriptional regulator, regulator of embCAB operon